MSVSFDNKLILCSPQVPCSKQSDIGIVTKKLLSTHSMVEIGNHYSGLCLDMDSYTWTKHSHNQAAVMSGGDKPDKNTSSVSCVVEIQTASHREQKGSNKSSTSSSSSSHRSGSGHQQEANGSRSSRGGNGRSYSSRSSDSSEDDKDDDDKRRRPYNRQKKEPKSKSGFSDDDDEATDSADEGVNQDTPTSIALVFSPQSQKSESNSINFSRGSSGGSKERYNQPTSLPVGGKARGIDDGVSMISVETIISSKEPHRVVNSIVPQSPINMTVGYGIPSATVTPPTVIGNLMEVNSSQPQTALDDKSPTESNPDLMLGTPTQDSPRLLGSKELMSPGTPSTMSPEMVATFPVEVRTGDTPSLHCCSHVFGCACVTPACPEAWSSLIVICCIHRKLSPLLA